MERPVPNLLSKLGGKYGELFDYWGFCQPLRSLCHQRCSDLPIEVCLPARLVGEGVEDAVGRRSQANREPLGRRGFFLDHR